MVPRFMKVCVSLVKKQGFVLSVARLILSQFSFIQISF